MRELLIRSVFDQYSKLENRLTNALVQLLASDQLLSREFVAFATRKLQLPPARTDLSFSCQRLPGDPRGAGN